MAHFHVKKKKGRPYLYVREMARVNGKPKVVSQIYIGSPERVAALASGQGKLDTELRVEEFGALWLAQQMDQDFDLTRIVDEVIPRKDREKGPSVGEYFLYCVWNRMIHAVSKNKLASWYKRTAIQQIRPVDIGELTSQRYWEKWDRVGENELKKIAKCFFKRLWEIELPDSDCLLFDTTNYYTYMASHTESDLALRGKNKDSKHHLRQIGLGLLVARNSRLPLYYNVYPGKMHDSSLFEEIMDEMFGIVCGLHKTNKHLTVVIDKGMNSEENFGWIDEHERIHFVTTYSTYFAEELATKSIDYFEPVNTIKNKKLIEEGKPGERLIAFRTKGEYWSKERAVIVTYNPSTARKKSFQLDSKLDLIRKELFSMRTKIQNRAPHWRNAKKIKERYIRLCQRLRIPSNLFDFIITESEGGLNMSFRKNLYRVDRKRAGFGKNIIITDNIEWTTTQIVEASLDRWQVEERFRISKDVDLVGILPIRHWTDSKIRCHLFACVVTLTYLRRLELKLEATGIHRSAKDVMDDMNHLHSVLTLSDRRRRPQRRIERPTKTQAEVLNALGFSVNQSGVLQTMIR